MILIRNLLMALVALACLSTAAQAAECGRTRTLPLDRLVERLDEAAVSPPAMRRAERICLVEVASRRLGRDPTTLVPADPPLTAERVPGSAAVFRALATSLRDAAWTPLREAIPAPSCGLRGAALVIEGEHGSEIAASLLREAAEAAGPLDSARIIEAATQARLARLGVAGGFYEREGTVCARRKGRARVAACRRLAQVRARWQADGARFAALTAPECPPPAIQPLTQTVESFDRWLLVEPGRKAAVRRFEAYLRRAGVGPVLPAYQLLRTASDWEVCSNEPFEVPPAVLWKNVVPTLGWIRGQVVRTIGPVEAVSGYRDPDLNACAKGAPASAHVEYWALDLVPLFARVDRTTLMRTLCPVHRDFGPAEDIGLGFYAGRRFHVDAKRFRNWGVDPEAGVEAC